MLGCVKKLPLIYFLSCELNEVKRALIKKIAEVVVRGCSTKSLFLKILQYSQTDTYESLFSKVSGLQAENLIKRVSNTIVFL